MRSFSRALFLCILFASLFSALDVRAQSIGTSIQYQQLTASPTGITGSATYAGSNCDSVFTVLVSTGLISGKPVYQAIEYDTVQGVLNIVNSYQQSANALLPYKAASNFTKGSGLGALFHYSVKREVIDTGLVVIGTPSGGTFVVTSVIITGNNDTTGYTSNATVKVGTAAGGYNNIVSTAAPTLGALGTVAATLVSPRADVPSGSAIYLHVTTAAVATTETISADVIGYYR